MKYIHTEKDLPIHTYNIAIDLKKFLMGYLLPLNFTYYIQKEKLTLEETFSPDGLLPLFLFNQNDFINSYIQNLNTKENKQFFVDLEFIYSPKSLLDANVYLYHNLIVTDVNQYNKYNFYYDFIEALALNILKKSPYFIVNNNEVHLDSTYNKYHAVITDLCNKSTNILPIEEKSVNLTTTDILKNPQIKNFIIKKAAKNKNTRKD